MNWAAILGVDFPVFLMVLGRTSGLIITAPYFQSRSMPVMVRAGLALFLALVLAPVLGLRYGAEWTQGNLWIQSFTAEVMTGLTMGYLLNLSFVAIQVSGQLIDVSIGFGVVNILDPQSGVEMPITGQFQQIMALWIFLVLHGDHLIIGALAHSYKIIPPAAFSLTTHGVKVILEAFGGMFLLGFQIALPIVGAIFLADLAMGIVSRLIPQINIFVTGFPIKIALGLLMLILLIPMLSHLMNNFASQGGQLWQTLERTLPYFHR
ncbi:MAG TPA: flagellar biosynthetic protein FliR [Bacillota bacterium]|nr:flagellar biosynthetic protein FliR [Bacillota bacterium]